MRAGTLNSRVKIQQQSTDQDGAGQPLTTWSDVATVWADIRHVSGLQVVKADAQSSTVKASVRIRFRDDVTAGMRLLHETTIYSIAGVLPDLTKREYVDLVCQVVS